jgi:hypothetical protein
MAYFAKTLNGKVIDVMVCDPSYFDTFQDTSPGTWIETDKYARGGIQYDTNWQPIPNVIPLRANYAYISGNYDSVNDVFYDPQPFPSWTISAPTWTWTAPVPYPNDGGVYDWNETTKQWVEVT